MQNPPNLLCVGKRNDVLTKKSDSKCLCTKSVLARNAKHIMSCCRKVSMEIHTRHDTVVKILLNNILVQRGVIYHEQKLEDRKTVMSARDEITVGTEHVRSED